MEVWHGTTIIGVRKNGKAVIAGDGQVSLQSTVIKPNAKKVRRLGDGKVIGGFAGATADAFTLFERFEGKLEKHQGHLVRAAIELTKDWRTDRVLRRLAQPPRRSRGPPRRPRPAALLADGRASCA